jgi:CBS domain-containing protein
MVFRWLINLFRRKPVEKPIETLVETKEIEQIKKKPKVKQFVKIKRKKIKFETKRILVQDLMSRKIVSVSPYFTLEKAAQIFSDEKVSGVPVLDKGFFIGELSKTDILSIVKKDTLENLTEEDKTVLRNNKVAEFMKKPICIHSDRAVEEAKNKMDKFKIKRLLVTDKQNQLVGIITRTDLLRGFSEEKIKRTVSTKIDELLSMIEKGPTSFSKISKSLNISENLIEEWAKILEEHDLVEISYPAMGSPILKLKGSDAKS